MELDGSTETIRGLADKLTLGLAIRDISSKSTPAEAEQLMSHAASITMARSSGYDSLPSILVKFAALHRSRSIQDATDWAIDEFRLYIKNHKNLDWMKVSKFLNRYSFDYPHAKHGTLAFADIVLQGMNEAKEVETRIAIIETYGYVSSPDLPEERMHDFEKLFINNTDFRVRQTLAWCLNRLSSDVSGQFAEHSW